MALINPPEVIPGTATVDIFTHATGVASVWAKPVYWFAGAQGTPQADEMKPVPGEPGHYRGIIWLMDVGTSGIEVEVRGTAETGQVIIPVMAVSNLGLTRPKPSSESASSAPCQLPCCYCFYFGEEDRGGTVGPIPTSASCSNLSGPPRRSFPKEMGDSWFLRSIPRSFQT
jgi:hypothetical protein